VINGEVNEESKDDHNKSDSLIEELCDKIDEVDN
jgi:hypothetical protein